MGRTFVTPAEIEGLRASIQQAVEATGHDMEYWREQYRSGNIPRAHRAEDLDTRFRWDLFWATNAEWRRIWSDRIYSRGGHDNHIDTALRQVVEPL